MLHKLDYNTTIQVSTQEEWDKIRPDTKKIHGGVDYSFPKKIPFMPVFIKLIKLVGNTDIFPYYSEKDGTLSTHLKWETKSKIITVEEFLSCT